MKQISFGPLFCLLLVSIVFPQDDGQKSRQLNQKMTDLFRLGNLDEAIPLAEQIVKLQRGLRPPNSKNLVNSLENLAQIKLTRFKKEMSELSSPDMDRKSLMTISEKMQKDARDTEEIYREALLLTENGAKTKTDQRIVLRNNLAWLLYNFLPPDAKLSAGFDKSSRDKFDTLNKARFYKRINEAESLYLDALNIGQTDLNRESDATVLTLFNLAEFELAMGNFENAIPRYEKCIAMVERKYGKNSQNLILPMESYAKSLAATDRDDTAFEIVSRIVGITHKTMAMPKVLLNISLRGNKPFITSNAPSVEQRAIANKESAELAGRGSILVSGVTGEGSFSQIQATSTFGRNYYDNSYGMRLIRVAVRVLIDETGKVLETEGLSNNKENNAEAEKIVKEWMFSPYKAGGQARKTKGYVECLFLAEPLLN